MFVVESKLYGQRRSAPRKRVVFGIALPVDAADGDVSCIVHIRGIDRPRRIFGTDLFQALALSVAFLRQRLKALESSGWRFYFGSSDSTPFDLSLVWFGETHHVQRKRPTNKDMSRSSRDISGC